MKSVYIYMGRKFKNYYSTVETSEIVTTCE